MTQPAPTAPDHAAKIRELLDVEAAAITSAAERLDAASVNQAVRLLLETEGKIVVSGVGKSGVIAQKIAQTLTSTGSPAYFLHPSDALHGGLGVVAGGDVVIALSNSGETDELLAIVPSLKQRGAAIISIVGNMNSRLAAQSDVAVDAAVDCEACPLNLAPTASTTVALAMGDALAMALMEAKQLTEEDFAFNHPAGRLGKRLTLRVFDIMHDAPSVSPSDGWLEVVHSMSAGALGAVAVLEADRQLVGIITDGDLRRTVERTPPEKFGLLTAHEMMTGTPISVDADALAFEALQLMEQRASQISVLPVMREGRCTGFIRLHDIVRAGL
jgi:arabinose-5-phosphate isomerase